MNESRLASTCTCTAFKTPPIMSLSFDGFIYLVFMLNYDIQLFKSPHFIPRNVFSNNKRKRAERMMTKTLIYPS